MSVYSGTTATTRRVVRAGAGGCIRRRAPLQGRRASAPGEGSERERIAWGRNAGQTNPNARCLDITSPVIVGNCSLALIPEYGSDTDWRQSCRRALPSRSWRLGVPTAREGCLASFSARIFWDASWQMCAGAGGFICRPRAGLPCSSRRVVVGHPSRTQLSNTASRHGTRR